MRSRNKSIEEKLLELLVAPAYKYKGVSVSVLGLPTFGSYRKQSIRNTIYRLKKNGYIYQNGDDLTILPKGREYTSKKSRRLQFFTLPFPKASKKDLLIIFDIPEEQKAEREWFRLQLRSYGYEMIQRSVWVGPSPLPKEFLDYLKFIGIQKCIKTFKLAKNYTLK